MLLSLIEVGLSLWWQSYMGISFEQYHTWTHVCKSQLRNSHLLYHVTQETSPSNTDVDGEMGRSHLVGALLPTPFHPCPLECCDSQPGAKVSKSSQCIPGCCCLWTGLVAAHPPPNDSAVAVWGPLTSLTIRSQAPREDKDVFGPLGHPNPRGFNFPWYVSGTRTTTLAPESVPISVYTSGVNSRVSRSLLSFV